MHRSRQLILLSCIDGDAPRAASNRRRTFGKFGPLSTFEAALLKASEPGSSNANRFAQAHPIRSLSQTHEGRELPAMSGRLLSETSWSGAFERNNKNHV
jgi:hypothetical protein